MGTVLAGLQTAHDTIIVHEEYSATRAAKMRFWARRWLVLEDIGQGSISCPRGASGFRPAETHGVAPLTAEIGRTRRTAAQRYRRGRSSACRARVAPVRPGPPELAGAAGHRGRRLRDDGRFAPARHRVVRQTQADERKPSGEPRRLPHRRLSTRLVCRPQHATPPVRTYLRQAIRVRSVSVSKW